MTKLKEILQKRNYKTFSIILVIVAIIGHILNTICPHGHFYFNQYILLVMLIIQKFIIKKIDLENSAIEKELKNIKEIEAWGSFNTKTKHLLHTAASKAISIILVFVYMFTMFEVGCLEHNLTGIYGCILGAIVFYQGIQAYLRYLMLLHFSWDLKNLQLKNYFFYIPSLTDWIVRLAREFSYIEKWFLVLGLMYTSIYVINIPAGTIVIGDGISFHASSNFLFIITWIGIIVFFAFAVPTFTFLSRHFIKRCIWQCKCTSIKKLEKQIDILSTDTSEDDLNALQAKLSLIKEISLSEDYPLKYKHTVFDKIYTICLGLLTLISPFTSIIEQVLFKR